VTLTHSTGGKPSMTFDGAGGVADTRIVPPTTVVPEALLGWVGVAMVIPLLAGRRRIWSFIKVRVR